MKSHKIFSFRPASNSLEETSEWDINHKKTQNSQSPDRNIRNQSIQKVMYTHVTDAFVGCKYQRRRRQDPAAESNKESDQKSG
jgi:hypothetical protein